MKQPVVPKIKFPKISLFCIKVYRRKWLFYLKIFGFSFITTFLLVSIMLRGYQLLEGLRILRAASAKRQEIQKERLYWEDVVKRYAGYRDAYFQLAVLSYQLGEKDKAKAYLEVVFDIDPNFREGRKFAKKVGL